MIASIEQVRARYAYGCAVEGSRLANHSREYKSYVKKIPALIKTNGLGATVAFIAAKKKDNPRKKEYAYQVIYNQLMGWLVQKGLVEGDKELVEQIISLNSPIYRQVTMEVLALFKWMGRFAEALIAGEAND
ncbi:hypothetical protein MTAT_24130 [Moorella thermoacetica]|uniref:CRISPR type III-B/RAMP module-associated protein Cmr5 n=2 Tax=Neomoorella thermoacetica TaxID=1525 RepID=A0AAC9MTY6_NEOTH|nr:type III-B CRISPR module-associated protein Cmr5 [Moorella thermoacetica]AOQ22951.1 CRISPR-associated protein (Cas_Cmr5) [Moorella thermoacetica]TYL10521.1 hypothetical protein MTAT_24130 [Moorella thermoacetica]